MEEERIAAMMADMTKQLSECNKQLAVLQREILKKAFKMIQNSSHFEALCFIKASHLQKRRFISEAKDAFHGS